MALYPKLDNLNLNSDKDHLQNLNSNSENIPVKSENKMVGISIELAEKMLIRFDGNKQKLHEFIDNCDKAHSLVNENNKNILFAIIETKITDNARALIRNRKFDEWKELKEHLLDIFSEKRTMGQWQLELNSLKQNNNESILEYSSKVETCYIKLINSLDGSLEEGAKKACIQLLKNQALSVFVSGLNKELALIVKSQKPSDLETAIALALSEEQELKSKFEIQKYQTLNTKYCSICKRNNHNTINCRFKPNNTIQFQKPQSKPNIRYVNNNQNQNSYKTFQNSQNFNHNSSSYTKFCNYCKRKGHLINECRKREYNERIRNQTQQTQNTKPSSLQNPTSNINSLNIQSTSETAIPKSAIQFQAESL